MAGTHQQGARDRWQALAREGKGPMAGTQQERVRDPQQAHSKRGQVSHYANTPGRPWRKYSRTKGLRHKEDGQRLSLIIKEHTAKRAALGGEIKSGCDCGNPNVSLWK